MIKKRSPNKWPTLFAAAVLALFLAIPGSPAAAALSPLSVEAGGRGLVRADGRPFFWLGDTAWALAARLSREEVDLYLADRAAKGFTVIQTVALWVGLPDNYYGQPPLTGNNPDRPNQAYFQHLDYILDRAEALGLHVALLPTWGDHVAYGYSGGPVIFDAANARRFGNWLGARYAGRPNLIWVLGGDIHPVWDGLDTTAVWEALAQGLTQGFSAGDPAGTLITFHPATKDGIQSSSRWLHHKSWLDFNMIQSGHHTWKNPVYELAAADYALTPVKPTLDAEPCYEEMPIDFKTAGLWQARDLRIRAYQSVLAGGFGFTYGANGVFQFTRPGDPEGQFGQPRVWTEALNLPGSSQMVNLRTLMEARPGGLVPDQGLFEDQPGERDGRIQAAREAQGGFGLVYVPPGRGGVKVWLDRLSGPVRAAWYDPRAGRASLVGSFPDSDLQGFPAPSDEDWVLILDDENRGLPLP